LKDQSGTNMMRAKAPRIEEKAAKEIPMYQRALPVRHPNIAPGGTLGAREQLKARTLFRAFIDQCLRLLRLLGEFFAAGGALS
jgi:hypothetical protein